MFCTDYHQLCAALHSLSPLVPDTAVGGSSIYLRLRQGHSTAKTSRKLEAEKGTASWKLLQSLPFTPPRGPVTHEYLIIWFEFWILLLACLFFQCLAFIFSPSFLCFSSPFKLTLGMIGEPAVRKTQQRHFI